MLSSLKSSTSEQDYFRSLSTSHAHLVCRDLIQIHFLYYVCFVGLVSQDQT
jgi:hypothetical protein